MAGDDWLEQLKASIGQPSQPTVNSIAPKPSRYDSYIEQSAARHGVDPDLIRAQMHQESTFKPGAISPKGASGLMQLMPETARRLGVTNIFDPQQNIEGGTKYMKQQLDKFGSVPLALAAYNAGPGRIKNGRIPNIAETQDYVKKITGRYKGDGYHPANNIDTDAQDARIDTLLNSDRPVIDTEAQNARIEQLLADNKGGQPVTPTVTSPQTVQAPQPSTPVTPTPTVPPATPPPSALTGIDPSQLFNGQARVDSNVPKPTVKSPLLLPTGVEPLNTVPQPQTSPQVTQTPVQPVTPAAQSVRPALTMSPTQTVQSEHGTQTSEPTISEENYDEQGNIIPQPVTPSQPTDIPQSKQSDNPVLGTVEVDPKWSDEQKIRFAANKVLPNYGVTSDQIENWITTSKERLKDNPNALVSGSSKTDSTFHVYKNMLDDIKGRFVPSTPDEIAERQKQELLAPPTDEQYRQQALDDLTQQKTEANMSAMTKRGETPDTAPTEAEIQSKIAELKANELSPQDKEAAYNSAQYLNKSIGGGVGAGFIGSGGSAIHTIAGALRPFAALGIPSGYQTLSNLGKQMQKAAELQGDNSLGNQASKLLGGLPINLGEMAVTGGTLKALELPNGARAIFALLGGAKSAGSGDQPHKIAQEILKGYGSGAAFDYSGDVGKAVAKKVPELESIAELGTVFGGSAAVNAVLGMPISQNLQSSITNTLFKAQELYGSKVLDNTYRFWKGGEPFDTIVDSKGKIELQKNVGVPITGGEIVLDPQNPVYKNQSERRSTATVPESGEQPEKQYTSQLDEIRQKGADTTAKVQALFPDAALTREEAADLRRQAFPDVRRATTEQPAKQSTEANQEIAKPESKPQIEVRPKAESAPAEKQSIAKRREISTVTTERGTKANVTPRVIDASDAKTPEYGSQNKIVTIERAEKAREILRNKLTGTQLNVGFDPDILKAGTELATFHVEAGARRFVEFSKAMVGDLGDAIKPYLKQLYTDVRDEHKFEGMDKSEFAPLLGKGVMGEKESKLSVAEKPKSSEAKNKDIGLSKIGQSIEQKAIEKGLVESFDRTAEYDKKHVDDQKIKVAQLMTDTAKMRNIIRGEEQLPRDIDRSMFIRGVELHADTLPEKEQVQLNYELGNSDIVRQTSEAAQTLRFAQEREPESTVRMMQEVRKARIAEVKSILKGRDIETAINEEAVKLAKTMKGAKENATRKASTKKAWHDFINSIAC